MLCHIPVTFLVAFALTKTSASSYTHLHKQVGKQVEVELHTKYQVKDSQMSQSFFIYTCHTNNESSKISHIVPISQKFLQDFSTMSH